MNMPVGGDQTVTFHSTLFALIRTSLEIKMKGNMFKNDQELRRAIQVIWPNMQERNIDKILPKPTGKWLSLVALVTLLYLNVPAAHASRGGCSFPPPTEVKGGK